MIMQRVIDPESKSIIFPELYSPKKHFSGLSRILSVTIFNFMAITYIEYI